MSARGWSDVRPRVQREGEVLSAGALHVLQVGTQLFEMYDVEVTYPEAPVRGMTLEICNATSSTSNTICVWASDEAQQETQEMRCRHSSAIFRGARWSPIPF